MGNLFSRKKEMRIIMQGLDAAGKTTILYKLKLGEVFTTIPTIGCNAETLEYKSVNFTVWDVSSQNKMQPLYRHYYPNTQALIFVVDSSDKERMDEARYELHLALKEEDLKDVSVVVLANKQDLTNALPVVNVAELLGLHSVKQNCNIFSTCAVTGDGLYEALDWLHCNICGTSGNLDVESSKLRQSDKTSEGSFIRKAIQRLLEPYFCKR